jgi:hypothetical protein
MRLSAQHEVFDDYLLHLKENNEQQNFCYTLNYQFFNGKETDPSISESGLYLHYDDAYYVTQGEQITIQWNSLLLMVDQSEKYMVITDTPDSGSLIKSVIQKSADLLQNKKITTNENDEYILSFSFIDNSNLVEVEMILHQFVLRSFTYSIFANRQQTGKSIIAFTPCEWPQNLQELVSMDNYFLKQNDAYQLASHYSSFKLIDLSNK